MRKYADSQNKVYIENGGIINTAENVQMIEIVNFKYFCVVYKKLVLCITINDTDEA